MDDPDRPPNTDEARRRYRDLAGGYDGLIRFVNPLRERVIRRLSLRPGDHVLDMGCGTGASLPALRASVGEAGRVTGIELTDEMAAVARRRIADAGWDNVSVIVGDATTAPLPEGVDGVLFFLVHDLTRMPTVIERALAALRPGGTVVAFGPAQATGLGAPLNLLVRPIARRYVTTFDGYDQPWSHLAAALPGLRVSRPFLGATYLAAGRTSG